jgi:hypothetical protein
MNIIIFFDIYKCFYFAQPYHNIGKVSLKKCDKIVTIYIVTELLT